MMKPKLPGVRVVWLALCAALPVALPAYAAGDDDKPADEASDDKSDDSDASDKSDDDKTAAAAAEQPKAPVEETIYVVQGKPFLVHGKFEIAPQFAQSVNDSFTSHTGLLLSGLYHLKENVAVEVAAGAFGWVDAKGARLGGRDSELTVELREKEALAPERVKLYQFPWLIGADAQWSPFYGKVSLQDLALGQFNLYLSVGASVLGLQLEAQQQAGTSTAFVDLPTPVALSTTFGGGMRFYFTDWLGVRLEVRDYVIPLSVREEEVEDADGPSFDVTNLVLGQAGVSFVF